MEDFLGQPIVLPSEFKVTITRADYNASSKRYNDVYNCPFASALKRTTQQDKVFVGPSNAHIGSKMYRSTGFSMWNYWLLKYLFISTTLTLKKV